MEYIVRYQSLSSGRELSKVFQSREDAYMFHRLISRNHRYRVLTDEPLEYNTNVMEREEEVEATSLADVNFTVRKVRGNDGYKLSMSRVTNRVLERNFPLIEQSLFMIIRELISKLKSFESREVGNELISLIKSSIDIANSNEYKSLLNNHIEYFIKNAGFTDKCSKVFDEMISYMKQTFEGNIIIDNLTEFSFQRRWFNGIVPWFNLKNACKILRAKVLTYKDGNILEIEYDADGQESAYRQMEYRPLSISRTRLDSDTVRSVAQQLSMVISGLEVVTDTAESIIDGLLATGEVSPLTLGELGIISWERSDEEELEDDDEDGEEICDDGFYEFEID